MDKAIIVDHLSDDFLKDVSFTIQRGEFVGIVGVGGSGKSSILNNISGISKPLSGFVSVLGYDPFLKSSEYLKQMSFLSGKNDLLLKNSPPIDSLEITKEIYGLSDREFVKNLNELTQFITDPVLLDALVYKPKILLLDEPNIEFELFYEYSKRNESTTIITTDKFTDLVSLVRRVIVIDEGKILFDGAIDEVIDKFAKEKIIKARLLEPADEKEIGEIGNLKKYDYPQISLSVPRSVASLAAAELLQNFPVNSLTIEEISVEEMITNMKA